MKIVASYVFLTLFALPRVLPAQSLTIDTVPAAPACLPSPSDTTNWQLFEGREIAVDVRLPATFHEKRYDVTIGDMRYQEWRGTPLTLMGIQRTSGPDSLESAAVVKQSTYRDYTECRIQINNHRAIVQSYRGGGSIFWDGKQFPSYNMRAAIQLEPGQYLLVSASAPTRMGQEVFLTAVRTIQIRDHVPP